MHEPQPFGEPFWRHRGAVRGAEGRPELTTPFLPNQDFDVYQKDVAGGVRLDADLRKQAFWVEIDLDAPGRHPGEGGF